MRYPDSVRDEALDLLGQGVSLREAAVSMGLSPAAVHVWARVAGMKMRLGRRGGLVRSSLLEDEASTAAVIGAEWVDEHGRLTLAGRAVIQIRRRDGWHPAKIAAEVGVHRSTVGRELARNTRGGCYLAARAQRLTVQRRQRPKPAKLEVCGPLRDGVVQRLNNRFSPQQVAGDLRRVFPGRDDMQVSHETIYQALYVQGKGALRDELKVEKALRSGRTSRRPRSQLPRGNRSWIGEQAHISQRPPEVADRAVPGHWEGDLVIGAGGKSALITLVERTTRYALIRRLPLTHDSITVAAALVEMMSALPDSLRRSLTWDQGSEMAAHAVFTLATGCEVYFADPHSPWQRGTNENTNGLVRDFHPKGTDFTLLSDAEITQTERLLNIRPRETLDWHTPADRLNELLTVATTA